MDKNLRDEIVDKLSKSEKDDVKPTLKAISKAEPIKDSEYDAKVVMTKEVTDRDGEVIKITGMDFTNYLKNPVVLDSHRMNGSVMDILGKSMAIGDEMIDGISSKVAFVKFADHPVAQYAKAMVQQGMLNTVSIGFSVNDYDYNERTVTKSELYELSFVAVPANPAATVLHAVKSLNLSDDQKQDIFKKLALLEDIHPKIKEFRKHFLQGELIEKLAYTITGNELVDISNVYQLILKNLEETTQPLVETQPQETAPETPTVEDNTPVEVDPIEQVKTALSEYINS